MGGWVYLEAHVEEAEHALCVDEEEEAEEGVGTWVGGWVGELLSLFPLWARNVE